MPKFKVGDRITFDYFGTQKTGKIKTVGKHGYWINDNVGIGYGCNSIRCPFENARRA